MAVARLAFENGPGLSLVFGYREENLRLLESLLKVRVTARGNEVTVKGAKGAVGSAVRVLERLREEPGALAPGDVRRLADGRVPAERDRNGAGRPVIRVPRQVIVPRSPRQEAYVKAIQSVDVVFGVGPAGTGKTYLAVACAVAAFMEGRVDRIILVRPVVEAGERLGFLPGDVQEKVNPYMRPLYDALRAQVDAAALRRWMAQDAIEIAPLAYMRGRTLSKAFIILDEAQNTTVGQMKMFLTRLGVGSKAVVTGDMTQVDLPGGTVSGLVHATEALGRVRGVRAITFRERDIVRHELVQRILKAYDNEGAGRRGGASSQAE